MNQKFTRKSKLAFTFLVSQLLIVPNSNAIKLILNGEPSLPNNTVLTINEDVVYSYSDSFRPIVTNTDNPFLCIGPNLGSSPSAEVSYGTSAGDPFKIYGLVGVSSATYNYNPVLLSDKTFNIQTNTNSQCVVKGFNKINNPNLGNSIIFVDSFEDGGLPAQITDIDITLDGVVNNQVVSNGVDLVYTYRVTNIGTQPIDLDVVDYFSLANNNTAWNCTESIGSDPLTDCGADAIKLASENYIDAVYLKNVHIEGSGDSVLISVIRNPSIASDGTLIDLLVTALVTSSVDSYALNNSETRAFIGDTNALPTIGTVSSLTLLEDSVGTGALDFTITDIETPAANLVVVATSSDQSIVSDGSISIGSGATDNDKTVTVVPNVNANTAFGVVTITLQVTDSGGGMQSSTFDLTITPVNDKPTFSVVAIADFAAGTSGTQVVPNFIQNVVYGPTTDENDTQTIVSKSISAVSDPNGVLSSVPLLFTDLILSLSGQGGTVTFDVQIQDDGMTANGGADTSDSVSVSLTVLNTLPVISMVSNTSVDEDNSTPILGFTISDAETAAGALIMSAMSSDTSIVPISGIQFAGSNGSRTVQIFPAMNQNTDGQTPVTITLIVDDGSNTTQTTFDLTINPINDAPTFSLDADINHVVADAGFQTALNYATVLSMGPTGDEDLNQNALNYNVVVTDASNIFDQTTVIVDINNNGTLNYVLTGNVGTATIDVSLQDDGATANGGVDTSATQSFTITVQ